MSKIEIEDCTCGAGAGWAYHSATDLIYIICSECRTVGPMAEELQLAARAWAGDFVSFHGYKIFRCGTVLGKKGFTLKTELRKRRGGGVDVCVRLSYGGSKKKWTLSRLVAACFHGPIDGYEINHKDRNTMNNTDQNLERLTPSENQKHWRDHEKQKTRQTD